MKNLRMAVGVVIALSFILQLSVTPALAAPPGPGWWTFYTIQNIQSTGDITISMQAYTQQGGNVADDRTSTSFLVKPGAAVAFHPGLAPNYPAGDRIGFTSDLPSNFQGSAVISSSGLAAAIAQVGNNQSGSVGVANGTASAFYPGLGGASAATTVNFPTVKNNFNGQTTSFYIQAAGGAANVTITYKMNDGSTHAQTQNIDQNRAFVFDPDNATPKVADTNCGSAASSPCLGAASVTSTSGTIVGVILEYPDQGSPAPFALSTRGLTTADQDTTIFAPTIKNAFNGGTTGFSVQNVGGSATTANIELTVTNASNPALIGTTYTDSEDIQPGEAVVFSVFRNNLGGMPAGTFAAAKVSSNNGQPLVGSVNESKDQANIPGSEAKAAYAAFPVKAATDTVVAPLVKELFNGNTTGVAVVNAGDQPTKIQASYVDASGAVRNFETTNNVAPGEAVSFFFVYQNAGGKFTGLPNFGVLQGTKNAATYKSSNGEELVALAQESDRANETLDIKNYEGVNLVP